MTEEPPQVVGRFAQAQDGTKFSLSGTALNFHFRGTGLSVTLDENALGTDAQGNFYFDEYQVVLDGTPTTVLTTKNGQQTYEVASGLSAGEHELSLVKRTETMVGEGTLVSVNVTDGKLLSPPARPDRRIEFIGDSITAGYGDEGDKYDCPFTAGTENYYRSFAALTARALGAENVAVAYSGKGVTRNITGAGDLTLPQIYGRALLNDPTSQWNFQNWVPQAVVINLGTNDFIAGVPDADTFVHGYEDFVRTVRGHYPKARIFIALGPLLSDSYPVGQNQLTVARADLNRVVSELTQEGDTNLQLIEFPELTSDQPMGCDWHPNVATHAQMADQLTAAIRSALGW